MKKLYYSSGHVLVGDTVCAAVMDYAKALGDVVKSDLIAVPSLSEDGVRGETVFLLGPASQLFAAPAVDRGVDLDDDEAVAAMRHKISRLQPARARVDDQDVDTDPGSFYDSNLEPQA
jgi:predicted RecA/RadA family phage recombinase